MSLNPVVSVLTDGKIKLAWTPDLTGLGYRFYRDGVSVSIGTKPSQSSTRFAAETDGRTHRYGLRVLGEIGPLEAAEYPPPVIEPPPPTSGLSPIGWLNNDFSGWWRPTNFGKYGIAVAYESPPAGFKGVALRYSTALTCYPAPAANGLSAKTAIANDWVLKDSNGLGIKRGAPYTSGYVADVGDPGYQQAWVTWLLARIAEVGSGGTWIDDSNPRILSMTGGVRPAKYPTDASYETAVLAFASYVHTRLSPLGLVDVYNTAIPADNTGALTKAWWARIGPTAGGLCVEGWMTPSGPTTAIRKVGGEWWNNWDGFRALHGVCQLAGTHFFPMNWDRAAQAYALATFLLDWDGATGSCQWSLTQNYTAKDDPWTALCDRVIALGQPTGPPTKVGNVWSRPFAGGAVTVDPVAGTATIA